MSRSSRRRGAMPLPIANRRLPPAVDLRRSLMAMESPRPSLGQDRRVYSPSPYATRTKGGIPTRLIAKPLAPRLQAPQQRLSYRPVFPTPLVAFASPKAVPLCVRRGVRKEVLHALGVAGKRGLGRGGVRRGPSSNVSC